MYRLRGRPAVHAAAARRKTGCNGVYGRHVWPDVCRHGSCVLSESFFWGTVAGSDVRPGIPPGCKFIWRKHHEVFPYGQPGLPAVSVPLVRPRPGRGQPEDLQHHRSGGCRSVLFGNVSLYLTMYTAGSSGMPRSDPAFSSNSWTELSFSSPISSVFLCVRAIFRS